MPRLKFTEKAAQNATCPKDKKKVVYSFNEVPGLILEAQPSGTASYAFRYRDAYKRSKQLKIGDRRITKLAQAREQVMKWRHDLLNNTDPQQEKKKNAQTPPFRDFIKNYYMPHIQQHKKSWETDKSLLKNHILPYIGNTPMDKIKVQDIIDYMNRHRATHAPGSSDRVLILSRYIFNLAIK